MSYLQIEQSSMKAGIKKDRTLKCSYKTATAEVLIGKAIVVKKTLRIMSIMFIENTERGNGNGSKLIHYLESYARQCRCNELWFPTVMSEKLVLMLLKKGFKLEVHHDTMMGQVEVFVKVFKK